MGEEILCDLCGLFGREQSRSAILLVVLRSCAYAMVCCSGKSNNQQWVHISSRTYQASSTIVLHCCRFLKRPCVHLSLCNVQVWNTLWRVIRVGNFVSFRRLIYQKVRCSIKVVVLLQLRVGRVLDNIEVSRWTVDFRVILLRGKFLYLARIGQYQELGLWFVRPGSWRHQDQLF